jgi:hypothetical protein
VNLLQFYSGLAHELLPQQLAAGLILPNVDHLAVAWSYKYMLSGESDVDGERFELLGVGHLANLYAACEALRYEYLANRAFNRAKTLIRTEGCWDAYSVGQACDLIPALRYNVINAVAVAITDNRTGLNTPHVRKLQEKGLGVPLYEAMEKRRIWLARNAAPKPTTVAAPKDVKCYSCGGVGHTRKHCPAARVVTNVQGRTAPTCFHCNMAGHISRNCWARGVEPNAQVHNFPGQIPSA